MELPSKGDVTVQVYSGIQREKIKKMLTSKIGEGSILSVLKILDSDPSLIYDYVSIEIATGGVSLSKEFLAPVACLIKGLTPVVAFAVKQGFPVDYLDSYQFSMLDIAIKSIGTAGQGADAAATQIASLLAMGANPNGTGVYSNAYAGPFITSIERCFPASTFRNASDLYNNFAIPSMLLDAGVDVTMHLDKCRNPVSTLIKADGWDDAAESLKLARFLKKLHTAGCPIDAKDPQIGSTPLGLALGLSNIGALITLIRLGANTSKEVMKTSMDLFDVMEAQKLQEHIPRVREAVMESVISQKTTAHTQKTAQEGAGSSGSNELPSTATVPTNQGTRRRMGAI